MCEAYKTKILKKYPMPEWPGEKFAPEQIALNEIALDGYKLRWHSDIIYQRTGCGGCFPAGRAGTR